MIDVKSFTDDELWLLLCAIEEFDDALHLREVLDDEYKKRNLDYRQWER